jgi:hypothetical protein
MIEAPVTAIAFDSRDVTALVQLGLAEDGYVQAELTAEQFEIFERYCSGSHLSGGFDAATTWTQAHFNSLNSDAEGYEEEGYGYGLPMGYCRFAAIADFVFYETTRGTILVVAKDGGHYVKIPSSREGGFHHSVLQNLLDGWTEDQIDRRINSHLYTERVSVDRNSVVEDDEFEDYDGDDEEYEYGDFVTEE